MRKRILSSVIITVLFSLIIVSSAFFSLVNVQEMKDTQSSLKNFNEYLVDSKTDFETSVQNFKINDTVVRCTLIDADGDVIYDNLHGEELDNHSDREEIIEANEKGDGYATRYSKTTEEKVVYYANKLNDGRILRTSVSFAAIKYFQPENIKYSVMIVLSVLLFAVAFSMKLVRAILDPLRDLEHVTSRIANGDLHIRVKATVGDELGSLGRTFNNMADQLQAKINEVIDKQNRLESILTSMESGVIAVDMDNNIIMINPYVKKVFGIRRDIVGKKLGDYIRDYDLNEFLAQDDEDDQREIKILHPQERELKIKKASIINGLDRIGKVIAVQDITDIKKLENMRSQFVTNVSHELKTPLTSIKGFAETLKYVNDEKTREKFLDIIDKEAERLTRLINDILVLSNIENNINYNEEEFQPNGVIENVINMLSNLAETKGIKLELAQKNNNLLYGDKDKYLQLVLNLVENSIKYSEAGSKVKVEAYSNGPWHYLTVEDNGIGIPKEDIPRIFERFYRVDKARKSGGTGLGLAIVKYIIKTFNGEIDVESEFGVGTKFTVKIQHL